MARILLLTHEFPPFRGGIAAVAHGLATGAAAIGHEPIVLAPDYQQSATEMPAADFQVLRFAGSTCPIVSVRRLARFTRLCRQAIHDVRPGVVHAVDPPAQMALTALARLRLASRYYFTVHGTEALRYRDELLPRLWMSGAFKRVAGVAAVSDAVLRLVMNSFQLPRERGFVAHPAITTIWHEQPARDRVTLRAAWGAADDDVVLLTIARVVPEKGQGDVIDALAQLPESVRRRALYVVVGSGPRDHAQSLSAAADAGAIRLIQLGEIDDASAVRVADAADLFVMPSRRTAKRLEGFGIAYIEAAARGLPALARATGGVAEAVRDGETGVVLAASAGIDAIAHALRRLIEDHAARRQLGAAARQHARAFTWDRHAATVYARFT